MPCKRNSTVRCHAGFRDGALRTENRANQQKTSQGRMRQTAHYAGSSRDSARDTRLPRNIVSESFRVFSGFVPHSADPCSRCHLCSERAAVAGRVYCDTISTFLLCVSRQDQWSAMLRGRLRGSRYIGASLLAIVNLLGITTGLAGGFLRSRKTFSASQPSP